MGVGVGGGCGWGEEGGFRLWRLHVLLVLLLLLLLLLNTLPQLMRPLRCLLPPPVRTLTRVSLLVVQSLDVRAELGQALLCLIPLVLHLILMLSDLFYVLVVLRQHVDHFLGHVVGAVEFGLHLLHTAANVCVTATTAATTTATATIAVATSTTTATATTAVATTSTTTVVIVVRVALVITQQQLHLRHLLHNGMDVLRIGETPVCRIQLVVLLGESLHVRVVLFYGLTKLVVTSPSDDHDDDNDRQS